MLEICIKLPIPQIVPGVQSLSPLFPKVRPFQFQLLAVLAVCQHLLRKNYLPCSPYQNPLRNFYEIYESFQVIYGIHLMNNLIAAS